MGRHPKGVAVVKADDIPNEPVLYRFTAATSIEGQPGDLVIEAHSYSDLQRAVKLARIYQSVDPSQRRRRPGDIF